MTTKVMPFLSVLAVMLCTAMVLIVWSIMGGFLANLVASGRTLMGDVNISWPVVGFAHYDDLVERLEADELVDAATPMIETFGMAHLPDGRVVGVMIKGVRPESFARVTGYEDALWWRPIEQPLPKDREGLDPRLEAEERMRRAYREGLALMRGPESADPRPAAVLGIELTGFNQRMPGGWYEPRTFGIRAEDGHIRYSEDFILNLDITLNVAPLDRRGRAFDVVSRRIPVANEFATQIYDVNNSNVIVPLNLLQQMLRLDSARRIDTGGFDPYAIGEGPDGREAFGEAPAVGVEPSRVTNVLVRAAPGIDPYTLAARCREIYAGFADDHAGVPGSMQINIATWEEQQAMFIAAVKKETALVLLILGFISLTAVFLILAIFWAMVSEKTRDIGVLRSLGASRPGVAWLWLRYGLAIGILGSALGMAVAALIVWNVNEIHDWLGETFNLYVWDPAVYYLPTIPNRIEPSKAAIVFAGGVAFSVMGALVPALRAAYMDPVRALRFD